MTNNTEPVRGAYLLTTEGRLLRDFARSLYGLFPEDNFYGPYLVGSALKRRDFRDIDVRTIMKDEQYDQLAKLIDIPSLNVAVSLWGQKATGLPIDFQVQRMSHANEEYQGEPRNAFGI